MNTKILICRELDPVRILDSTNKPFENFHYAKCVYTSAVKEFKWLVLFMQLRYVAKWKIKDEGAEWLIKSNLTLHDTA